MSLGDRRNLGLLASPHVDFDRVDVFGSLQDFLASIEKPCDMLNKDRASLGNSFPGLTPYADCVKLARKGWPEGTQKIKKLSELLYNRVTAKSLKRQTQYRVAGGRVIVGRHLQGRPDCFQYQPEVLDSISKKGHKVIKIVHNISVSAAVSSEVIEARGAAVAALIDVLESQGRRVDLFVSHSVTSWASKSPVIIYIHIKQANEPLQLDQLAFVLAHPGMLRRLQFSNMEHWPAKIRDEIGVSMGGAYGTPHVAPETGDITITTNPSYGDGDWKNPTTVVAWIIEQCKAQGIEFD